MNGWGASALVLATLAVPARAGAQAAAPAAPPAYDLFRPVPEADLRPLCTDRPSRTTSPCTVDAGHLQIETDLVNLTVAHSAGLTTTTWLATNPTVKLGLLRNLDVEANMVPVEIVTVEDTASGASTRQTGVGDLFLKVKWGLIGDRPGAVSLALLAWVKAPTAKEGIGNGAVEAGVLVPMGANLPFNLSLALDPEIDLLKNAAGGGRHVNASVPISLSHAIGRTVTLSAEVWVDTDLDPQTTTTQASADLALAWIPARHPNFQLDGGVNLGLNSATPGVQAYLGVSRRF